MVYFVKDELSSTVPAVFDGAVLEAQHLLLLV